MKILLSLFLIVATAGLARAQTSDQIGQIGRRQAVQHYRNGQELMVAELFEKAEREFSAAVQLDPLLTLAHYGLGQSFMAQKRYASAVLAYIACRDAYDKIFALLQSDTLNGDRRMEEEIRELRDSANMIRGGRVKGYGEVQITQIEARIDELERMRTTNVGRLRTPAELSLALGSAYFRSSQLADAEREWRAAVSVNSALGEAHNNLAALFAMTGRKKEAEEAVRAAERARFRVHPQLKEDIRRMK